jgi:hypothetical protein
MSVNVHEVAGIAPPPAFDATSTNPTGTGTTVKVGTSTVTNFDGEYLFAAIDNDGGTNTFTANGPFTERSETAGQITQTQDWVQPTAGAVSSTWTMSGTDDALAQMATFKASAVTTLAWDNFNSYTVNGGLGANWTTVAGRTDPFVDSFGFFGFNDQFVKYNGPPDSVSYYNVVTWPNDQWAQVRLRTLNNSGDGSGVVLRASNTTTTYYECYAKGGFGASASVWINKYISGSATTLASTTATVNADDVMYCEVQGTTLKAKINNVTKLTTTDSSIASGSAGVILFVDSGGTSRLDDFYGGSFPAGGAGATRRIRGVGLTR